MKAYTTDNPVAIQAFTVARETKDVFIRDVIAAAADLGKNKGPMHLSTAFGEDETIGLGADDPEDPPTGWTYSKKRGYLVPRRGKAGDDARQWLKDHQPPREARLRERLAGHGLPQNDIHETTPDGTRKFNRPAIHHHNGRLYALYRGTPGRWYAADDVEITWEPCKLSEYYAAVEAAESEEGPQ